MRSAIPVRLLDLLRGTAMLAASRRTPLLVAALSFAMLLAVGSAAARHRISSIEAGLRTDLSMDETAFESELQRQLLVLGSMDFVEFMGQAAGTGSISAASQHVRPETVGVHYVLRAGPIVLAEFLFALAVSLIAWTFFLLLFSRSQWSAFETASALPLATLKMCGLVLWMLVRSLVWIPFVGPFIALYLVPRLCLAPPILASGRSGVFGSLSASLKATEGRWIGVVLSLLVLGISAFFLLWILLFVAVAITFFSLKLGYVLWLFSLMMTLAFLSASSVVMAAQAD